ncbi:hypothetical protein D3C84_746010 [compost metagenome]
MGGVTALQHMLIEEGFAQHFIVVAVQGFQQPVFAAGQAGGLLAVENLETFIVEMKAVYRRSNRRRRRSTIERDAAQNRFDAHPQLDHAEGLGQVIIGTQPKTADAIGLGPQRRHQQHRGGVTLAQLRQHRQAVQPGQQNVHQHHIEGLRAGSVEAFLAVLAPGHLKAASAQMLMNIGTEYKVVFDGKDARMTRGDGSHEYLQIILS